MIKVRLEGGNREEFTGILGNIKWVDGKATVANLTQRLASCYGVVEDKPSVEDKPTTITLAEAAKASGADIVDDVTKGILEATEIEELNGDSIEIILESEDTIHEIPAPIDPEVVFESIEKAREDEEADEGAKALSDIVTAKKQEIEQAASKDTNNEEATKIRANGNLKKSDIKSFDDFKGQGSWGTYKKYVMEVTGTSPRNKKECAEALSTFIATLED